MLIGGLILAALLCALLTASSFLAMLYVESLRLRPSPHVKAFNRFEAEIAPRLRLNDVAGIERFSMLRQVALVLLTVDLMVLLARDEPVWLGLVEPLVLTLAAMGFFVHVLPRVLLTRTAGRWTAAFLPLLRLLGWFVAPLALLTRFANSIVELGGEAPAPAKTAKASEEIQVLLDAGEEEGLIGEEDRKLIESVVEFGDKTVREVMTARPQIVAIEASKTAEDLRSLLIAEEYSRIPVYEGGIDSIIGFVHSRDTLEIEEDRRATMPVRELVRPIALVPETKPIHELMREMQQKNAQMAVVIDEYGQTAGIVTMEDLMEEIVGEIRDESEPDQDVVQYADQSFVASGNLDLDRLTELVGFRPDHETESTTVGGFVTEELGQVPNPGAKLRLDGIEIEVLSADERRVRSVRVRRAAPPEEAEGEAPPNEASPSEDAAL